MRVKLFIAQPARRSTRRSNVVMTVACDQGELLPRPSQDVLLDDFQRIFANLGDDTDMAVFCVSENEQVISARLIGRAVLILKKSPPRVQGAIGKAFIKEAFSVTHYVRHFVASGVVIKSFYKLDTLPLLTVVVAVFAVIFPVAPEEKQSVVINRNAVIAINCLSYLFATVIKQGGNAYAKNNKQTGK